MKAMRFVTTIHAPKQKVWQTLWQDATFREWAGIIDPGTYMVGDLQAGQEVQFISAENGYGVTSLVKEVVPDTFLLLLHQSDTQDTGSRDRPKEWTGGAESYSLSEADGTTTLTTVFDVPPNLEEYFTAQYPLALARVKSLAEQP